MTLNKAITTRVGLALGFVGALSLAGCDSADDSSGDTLEDPTSLEDVQKELGEATDAVGDYAEHKFQDLKEATYAQKESFQTEAEKALANLDRKMKDLGESVDELGDDAKAEGEETLRELEDLRQSAGEKLDKAGESSGEAWEDVRAGFVSAYHELEKSLAEAKAEFDAHNGDGP